MKKRIPAIILMFTLFLTTSYAANTYRKTITVTSGVNVEFNNEAIDMTDANGKAVEAFIYNGMCRFVRCRMRSARISATTAIRRRFRFMMISQKLLQQRISWSVQLPYAEENLIFIMNQSTRIYLQ